MNSELLKRAGAGMLHSEQCDTVNAMLPPLSSSSFFSVSFRSS